MTEGDGPPSGSGSQPWGIGVTLSGGGHRATLVTLGALLALVDTGWNRSVRSMTSVSGSSLASAHVWARCDYRAAIGSEFDTVVQDAMSFVQRGAVFGTRGAKARFIGLGFALSAIGIAAVWSFARDSDGSGKLLPGFLLVVLFSLVTGVRGAILERNLQDLWFPPTCKRTTFYGHPPKFPGDIAQAIADKTQPTLHLIATTDLVTGKPVYFTQGAIIVDGMAWPLTNVPLARAVRASMSVPVLLPPVAQRLRDLVQDGRRWVLTRHRRLQLVDGGLFNNLGTDWESTHRSTVRAADYSVLHPSHEVMAETRVVLDASAIRTIGYSRLAAVPVVRSFFNVARVARVAFASGLYARQLSDVRAAASSTVPIEAGRFDFRPSWSLPDDMHLTRAIWAYVAERVSATPTTLRGLSADDCTVLVAHGYRQAIAAMYDRGAIGAGQSAWDRWLGRALWLAIPPKVRGGSPGLPTR